MRYLTGFIMALSLSVAAYAQEDALPQSVTQPYLLYEAAMEARDYAAARDAAREAWQAARADRDVPRDIAAQLAENYGQLAQALGDAEAAYRGWRDAAELSDRADAPAELRAWRWHNASLSAYASGDLQDSRSCSSRAVDAARDAGEALPADLAGEAHYLLARVNAELGRLRASRSPASRALEYFQAAGRDHDAFYGDAYYLSGMTNFFFGARPAAARDFHMARGIYGALDGQRREDALTAHYWVLLATDGDGENRRAEFAEFVANSGYEDGLVGFEFPSWEGPTGWDSERNRDARMIERDPPRFPANAAAAGLEGIVMVIFDVSEEGRPVNIRVAASAPSGVFDDASVEAVEDWIYEPARIDGEAVVREALQTQFIYELAH